MSLGHIYDKGPWLMYCLADWQINCDIVFIYMKLLPHVIYGNVWQHVPNNTRIEVPFWVSFIKLQRHLW